MAKITVDGLVRGARADALFNEEYTSGKARIRRVLGEALFRLRKGRNLTQAALAERAGWPESNVAKIERGDVRMITALDELETFAHVRAQRRSSSLSTMKRRRCERKCRSATCRHRLSSPPCPRTVSTSISAACDPTPVTRVARKCIARKQTFDE